MLPIIPLSLLLDVILSYQIMMFDLVHLVKGETPSPQVADIIHQSLYQKVYYITLCCQVSSYGCEVYSY